MEKVPVVGDQFKVNPVSTSMKCVISLTIQYMVIYTALALCRTLCHVLGGSPKDWERFMEPLEQAVNTVAFAPMLAVLFLGCRMRVTGLTHPMEKVPVVGDLFKVNPVSASMKCVITLTIQYMVIYTALALCRTLCHVLGSSPKDWERFTEPLEQAVNTVAFAPMLAVLILGCRMRVTWLTQGKGNPPE